MRLPKYYERYFELARLRDLRKHEQDSILHRLFRRAAARHYSTRARNRTRRDSEHFSLQQFRAAKRLLDDKADHESVAFYQVHTAIRLPRYVLRNRKIRENQKRSREPDLFNAMLQESDATYWFFV